MQAMLILLVILVSLIPIFYINKWLQRVVLPRKSFGRLILYFVLILELIFLYTFFLVLIIANLFPVAKG